MFFSPVAFWRALDGKGRVLTVVGLTALVVVATMWTREAVHDWRVDRHDAFVKQQIEEQKALAAESGAVAEATRTERALIIEQMNSLVASRSLATANTRSSAHKARMAQSDYEKTLTSNPSDDEYSVVLSDQELCARLERLNIACR